MKRFEKHPANPVYGDEQTGTMFDVYVWQDGGKYRMDVSWRPEKAVAAAFSSDGLHWTAPKITLPADPDSTWETKINRNCVLHTPDGKYRMWYTGQDGKSSAIAYAESDDGLEFHRVAENPVITCEYPWEGMSVMNPCVLPENGVYRMWYAAGETYEPNVIAYAESKDGVHWVKHPEPIYVCDPKNEYEQNRVGGCQVLKHETLGYLMFYIGYKDIHTACICAACSPDGIGGWKRCRLNPLIVPTEDGWDGDACYKPTAIFDGEGWRIWYNGRRARFERIGTAYRHGDFTPDDFA